MVGWDAADWKVITPLMDDGQMPHLQSLVERGVMGNLATLYPALSPMLWTSIATGKRAWKHGIYGFSEPDPTTGGVRPISNLGRKCKALWNILTQSGLRSNVVGWWPSHPAEPIDGVMVSDHFKQPTARVDRAWPLSPGAIHPPQLAQHLEILRIHPHELDGAQLLPFVPRAAEIDQQEDLRIQSVAKCLAECSTVHAAATAVMQAEPWDFMAVYYDAIDHFSHGFMRYHPPRLDWISQQDFEIYKDVVTAAYRYHDLMLGTLLHLAGKDTTVVLISDHGFHPDHLRPRILPNEPAGPAEEHRQFGIFVMAGPDIKQDELVFGANLLDIAPTVLTLFGLPTGRDMDGAPLVTAWQQPPQWQLIDSWDDVPGEDGRHSPGKQIDPVDSHDAMQQLVELGYVDRPDENQQVAVANTVRELRYNLARAYWGADRVVEALAIFEELWHAWPAEHRFGVKALECCLKLERVAQARDILEQIRRNKRSAAADAAKELEELKAQRKTSTRNFAEPSDQEFRRLRGLERKAATNADTFHYLEGRLLHAEGRHAEALLEIERARGVQLHNQPGLLRTIGEVCLALRRWKRAEEAFLAMLEIDPINANARLGLAQSLLPRRRFEEALQQATAAVGLIYHQPRAHFVAGLALARLGRYQEAASTLHTAIAQNPIFPRAHRRLARLYAGPLADPVRAAQHRALEQECRRRVADYFNGSPLPAPHNAALVGAATATLGQSNADDKANELLDEEIVVVSGLPRSGTSMMMQMLAAGGCPVLSDDRRAADASNRRGYFEFEPVKRIAADQRWLEDAPGKAVKIVAQLLPHLPLQHRYRVVFMERDLSEVVASQHQMLQRLGRPASRRPPADLARTFQKQVDAVGEILHNHSEQVLALSIDYADALADPQGTAARVNRFLGGALDESAMASAIEPALRNQ